MKWLVLTIIILVALHSSLYAQQGSDSAMLEKLRKESGVDPTRVQSRGGYSILVYDQHESAGQINNRISLNLGVNRWNFSMKCDFVSRTTGEPGSGFTSGIGDTRFSLLNAFFVKGKHAVAGAAEFSIPTGKPAFGSQYFSVTPSLTYSYTIKPSLFFAVQPQYTFALMKDPAYPSLSVITVRSFLAKFTSGGYFFVFEPRPVLDLTNDSFDLILSPIIGKALGSGFNLIVLAEFPTNKTTIKNRGNLYQFGFNKNF
jgi:Putative MetA-pathway of phenol degradation